MSAETVRQIIIRAVAEPEFRGRLLRRPAEASAGYDLSEAEIGALHNLTAQNFDAVAAGLAARAAAELRGTPAEPAPGRADDW